MKKILFLLSLFITTFAFAQFDENVHYTTIDKASIGTGNQTYILPSLSDTYDDEKLLIKNSGSGTLTVDAFGVQTIDEQLSVTLQSDNDSMLIIKDVNNPNNWNIISQTGSVSSLSQFYTYFSVWAEENGALLANNTQWSFGNGSVGNIAVVLPEDMELYAVSLSCEIFEGGASVNLLRNGATTTNVNFTINHGLIDLGTPIQFNAGDRIGFQTATVVGTNTDARVVAHFRIPFEGVKGDTGDPGPAGADGIPSQVMRVTLNQQTNVNVTTPLDVSFDTATVNTIPGAVVGANTIVVPQGKYFVTFRRGFDGTGGQRTSIGLNFMRNGLVYSSARSSNYIRTTGGHNFAGDQYSEIYDFSAGGGTIGFQNKRESESTVTNAVIFESTTSIVLIQKLSD